MRLLRSMWFLAWKDLRIFATDRWALIFSILFPFMFVILFSLLLGDVGSEDERFELNLVTQEAGGGMSHQIIGAMETGDESQLRPGEPKIVWLQDYDEARQQVEDKELGSFVAFPAGFTDAVSAGNSVELEVVVDAEDPYARATLNWVARSIASRIGSGYVVISATRELLEEQGLSSGEIDSIVQPVQQSILGQAGVPTRYSLIGFETENVGEVEPEQASNFVIPGYLVMFVFFTAALSAERIVRERQNHTLERLLSSSVRRETILGGIFTGTAAKGVIQIAIFWTVGILAFKIDLGLSPAAAIILSVLVIIMSSAFGVMLATLVKTDRAAGSIGVLASLILAPLGGCWWPLFITPKWMQFLAKFTPHGWAMSGLNKLMLFGADFGDVMPEMLALVGFAVLFGVVGVWRFRTSAT